MGENEGERNTELTRSSAALMASSSDSAILFIKSSSFFDLRASFWNRRGNAQCGITSASSPCLCVPRCWTVEVCVGARVRGCARDLQRGHPEGLTS